MANLISDPARREALRRQIENDAERQRKMDHAMTPLSRARRAMTEPGLPHGVSLESAARAVFGNQDPQQRDDPFATYGLAEQPQLGVLRDKIGVLKNRIAQSEEDAERAEWQQRQRVSAPDPETIDPRGLADRKDA